MFKFAVAEFIYHAMVILKQKLFEKLSKFAKVFGDAKKEGVVQFC